MIRLEKKELLERVIKTLEFIKADKRLIFKLRRLIQKNEKEDAYELLKNFNEHCEEKQEIKIARPSLHGFNEGDIFTRLIQEAYVTAKLFSAEDRLINFMWSSDWEVAR